MKETLFLVASKHFEQNKSYLNIHCTTLVNLPHCGPPLFHRFGIWISTLFLFSLQNDKFSNILQLDAALEGEVETVKKAVAELVDASKSNDDGITALHNAICAEHFNVVKYLVEEAGADVNATGIVPVY